MLKEFIAFHISLHRSKNSKFFKLRKLIADLLVEKSKIELLRDSVLPRSLSKRKKSSVSMLIVG